MSSQVRSQIKDIYSEDDAAPSASTPIVCESCGSATVKPSTVLFGSSLPPEFFSCADEDMPGCDLRAFISIILWTVQIHHLNLRLAARFAPLTQSLQAKAFLHALHAANRPSRALIAIDATPSLRHQPPTRKNRKHHIILAN